MMGAKKITATVVVYCLAVSFLTAQGNLDQGSAMSKDAQARMDKAFAGQEQSPRPASPATAPAVQTGAPAAQAAPLAAPAAAIAPAAAAPSVPAPTIARDQTGKPNWVARPDSAFDKRYYVTGVGSGATRQAAEAAAFAGLVGFFGQTVRSNISAVETYKERVVDGAVSVESGNEANSAIEMSSSMNQLIGSEIKDRWEDSAARPAAFWAVASMEIPRTIKIYAELIDANDALIAKAVAAATGNTFDAIARYQLAASLADANTVFSTVISLVGGGAKKSAAKSGDDYRYEANNIAKKIPVNVVVKNDINGRVKAAFADVFTKAGFRTGSANSRYVLEVSLMISPVELANKNKFSRFEINAELKDKNDNIVLMPYSANGREGHASQSEADQRALRAAESKIKDEFAEQFKAYLTESLPKR
jgi:hypothetical protein